VPEETKGQNQGIGRTRSRAAAWLAWSLAALSVAGFVASGVFDLLALSAQPPDNRVTVVGIIGATLTFVAFLAFPIVGAMVASRRPRNPIGWICLADGLLWMLLGVTESYSDYGVARPGSVPFPVAIGTIGIQWLWVPTIGLLGIFLVLLFPDGSLPSRRWRPLALFSGTVIVLLSITGGLTPGPLENQGGVRNPFGVEALPWLEDATYIILPLLPLCILASAVSMVLRFRRSRGEVRQQIKWIAFVATFSGLFYLVVLIIAMIVRLVIVSKGAESLPPTPLWLEVLSSVAVLGFAGVPIAIGFAVLKYRLYDIDVLINRTLVYASLTATLVALYFGGVVGLQAVFRSITGQGSTLAVVASTLAIAALFNPLRRRIQVFVDRRFYRRKYDAAKTLEAFSGRLREETNLGTLSDDLVGVIRDTMQPEHVSLWLRPDPGPGARSAATIEKIGQDTE
jgi:hypothetical protein